MSQWNKCSSIQLLFLLVFLFQMDSSSAQEFLIHKYDHQDHLPSLHVTGVCQDHSGHMWFSTRAGLVLYDGVTWEVVNPSNRKSPRSYRHVVCDGRGRIWALAVDLPFHISCYDGTTWESFNIPPPGEWGWDLTGFAVADQPDETVFMAMASDRILSFWDGRQWTQFGHDGSLIGIKSLVISGQKVFLATDTGLVELDIPSLRISTPTPDAMGSGPIQALAVDKKRDSGIWVVGSHWIGRYGNGEFEELARGLSFDITKLEGGTRAIADPWGGLFFGSVEDLFYFNPQRGLRTLGMDNGLISNGTTSLFLDREQNVWITSLRGISKVVSLSMGSYHSGAGLAFDEVTAIIQRPDESMVLGHNGGLTILGPNPVSLRIENGLPGLGRAMDLATDPQGRLWIAFDKWGLAQMNEDLSLQWFGVSEGLPKYVYTIHFDSRGEMWIGGTGGLYRKVGQTFVEVPLAGFDSSNPLSIRRINEGRDGALLLASGTHGVFRRHEGKLERWNGPEAGLIRSCFQVYDRGDGQYWVATSAGLCRVNNGRLELTTAPDPVITRPIYSFLEDDQGEFWFGTDRGVVRWDGQKLTTLGTKDGIQGREFNRDALIQAKDGKIWMGTDRGLTVYDSLFDQPRTARPFVSIQPIVVDGQVVDRSGNSGIEPSVYEIVIPFSAVSFLDENNLMFRTWLEGLEPRWQDYEVFPTRRIRYTNLSPGEYRFHLQARNIVGVESAVVFSESFRVKAPLTQTWWFLLLEIMGGLVLAAGVVFLLMVRRFQVRLQNEVRQRTWELRITERAVRSESQRLFSILASISDGVLAVDHNLNIVISNPMALSILGVQLDEAVGNSLAHVLKVEPSLEFDGSTCSPVMDRGNYPAIPLHLFVNKSGERRSLEISLATMSLGDDSPKGWVLAFRDVTDRHRMEKEVMRTQQLESLGVLAGGIAHDFNNLLTIMLGNLSLVENSKTYGDEQKFRLGRMKAATLRARDLAEQLLTFSRGGEPILQSVDLGQLVKQATSFALSGSSVSSKIKIPDDLWLVEGDLGQLGQIVSNLVINAMQAMPDGGVMELELYNLPGMPGQKESIPCVGMTIRDEGEGIEPENLEQIFNPYFSTKGTGSGLGLTIAHSIVSHHGGIIQVESRPKEGTTFRVYLPASTSSAAVVEKTEELIFPPGLRALVLDDEKDVLLLAEQMLTHLGLKVVSVTNGEAAVDAFAQALGRNRPFDVVVADLTIPGGIGGVEAFRKIRAMDDAIGGIVISGYSNDKVMAEYRQYGFGAAVQKPFDQAQLAEGLATVILNNRFK